MQADQSPSPDTRMNGLASSPLIPPCHEVDTKRDRAISPRDRSGYDLFDHSTQPNPAYNQKTLCPRHIQHTARHLRSCCLFKVAVCRHYLMLSILTRMTYFNDSRYQMPASNASPIHHLPVPGGRHQIFDGFHQREHPPVNVCLALFPNLLRLKELMGDIDRR